MSESIRTEEQRMIAELKALVQGQAHEIARLGAELDYVTARARENHIELQEAKAALRDIAKLATRHKKRKAFRNELGLPGLTNGDDE